MTGDGKREKGEEGRVVCWEAAELYRSFCEGKEGR